MFVIHIVECYGMSFRNDSWISASGGLGL